MSISGKNPVAERLYGPDGLGPKTWLVPVQAYRFSPLEERLYGKDGLGPKHPGTIVNLHEDMKKARLMRP